MHILGGDMYYEFNVMGFFLKNCVVLWNMTSAMIILVLCSPDAFADSLCQNFDWYFWPLRTTRNHQCCTTSMLCRIFNHQKKNCKKRSLLLTENNTLLEETYGRGATGTTSTVLFSRFLSRKFIVIRPHPFLFSAAVSVVSVQNFPPAMKATLLLLLGGYLSAAFM